MQDLYNLAESMPVYVPLAIMLAGVLLFLLPRLWLYGTVGRSRKSVPPEQGNNSYEAATVIIYCRDEGEALKRNLPAIINQKGIRLEVVAIDDGSNDSTAEVLKHFSKEYPNLRCTFVPASARYVSHTKLAVTLGVKAAKYEWIVLTRPGCSPRSDRWLETMGRYFTPENDIVLGYSNYTDESSHIARRAVYERLMQQLFWFCSTSKRVLGGDGGNMAFRRSLFMKNNGYASMLDYTYGVDDMLVRSMALPDRTAICCLPEAFVMQEGKVTAHAYRNMRLSRTAAQMRLTKRERLSLVPIGLMNLGTYLLVLGGAALAFAFYCRGLFAPAATAGGTLLIVLLADILAFRKVTNALGAPKYSLSLIYYNLMRPLASCAWKLKCRLHRADFNRKI